MKRRTTAALALLLLTRFALGAVYSLVVPIWEAYDEDGHFAYVRYLAKYRHLLDPADPEAQLVYEKFQPPLYYALVAPFVAGFDLGEALPIIERNPFWAYPHAGHNYALHPPTLTSAEAEIALAVHTARLVGVGLSTLSVLFVYDTARRVWARLPTGSRRGPVWAATLLYAFWPQFLFSGSTVNNDLAVTAFSAGALALMVALITGGFQARRALALVLLFAAAALSKLNALALLPAVAAATAISLLPGLRQVRWRSPRPWLTGLALVGVVAGALAVLSGLPFVTEQILHVEALMQFIRHAVTSEANLSLIREAAQFASRSYFASFGWGKVDLPHWLYGVYSGGLALGGLGLVAGAVRRQRGQYAGPEARVLLLMGLTILGLLAAALALVVTYQMIALAPGRYLLPALPAVCVLLVEGYRGLLPQRVRHYAWRTLGLGVILLGWAIPLTTLIPTYAIPQPLHGNIDVPVTYAFGESIQLIGHQTAEVIRPGETAQVSLCWQTTAPLAENYTVLLEITGADGQAYSQLATYPGRGNFPTRYWTPGVPFCDRYDLVIEPNLPAPAQAWLNVALLSEAGPEHLEVPRLAVIEPDGRRSPLDAFVLPLKAGSTSRAAAPAVPLDYRFGDALWLRGYSLSVLPEARSVRVTFQWQALRDLAENYVVFVHLRDSPQSAYAQADSAPRGGWYPTHLWQKGEIVEDVHVLTLPEGDVPPLGLYVGVVQPDIDTRLPAVDASGERLLNDELVLAESWALEDWALPGPLRPPDESAP
jgi:hypothetical protein